MMVSRPGCEIIRWVKVCRCGRRSSAAAFSKVSPENHQAYPREASRLEEDSSKTRFDIGPSPSRCAGSRIPQVIVCPVHENMGSVTCPDMPRHANMCSKFGWFG